MKRILAGLIAIVLIFSNINVSVMAMPQQNDTVVSVETITDTQEELQEETVSGNTAVSDNDAVSGNDAEPGSEPVTETEQGSELTTETEPVSEDTEGENTVSDNTVSGNDIEEDDVFSTTKTFLVDEEAPYDGNFVLISNVNTDEYGDYESTGILPTDNVVDEIESEYNSFSKTNALSGEKEQIYGMDKYGRELIDPSRRLAALKEKAVVSDSGNVRKAERSQSANYAVDDERVFYVDRQEQIDVFEAADFVCLAVGTYSTVWVTTDDPIYQSAPAKMKTYMQKVAAEFDKQYPVMTDAFGSRDKADAYGDNDGKVAILCYDIDGNGTGYGSYVAGYFYSLDLNLPGYIGTGSGTDCIHIDSYQGMNRQQKGTDLDVADCYGTLVHEFQHMINFSICEEKGISDTPTYLNEAFSEASAYICYGPNAGADRIYYYNDSECIPYGLASLLSWGYFDVLDNYALAYLFSQYIRTQYEGGSTIYKDSMNALSKDNDDLLQCIADNLGVTKQELLQNFHAALFLKNAEGEYGFKGEKWAESIQPQCVYLDEGEVDSGKLYPGGFLVVRSGQTFTPSENGENIKFMGMYSNKTRDDITVKVSGSNKITTNKGQVQLSAAVSPVSVSQDVIFTIPKDEDKEKAQVTKDGLVTALGNGTITVRATSVYEPSKYGDFKITISGQLQVQAVVTVAKVPGGIRIFYQATEPENAKLYCTVDGSIPTKESMEMPEEGVLFNTVGKHTLRVLAVDPGNYYNDNYLTSTNTITASKKPTIKTSEDAGSRTIQTITLSAETGASIYYTTDGSVPTIEEGTLYTEPVVLDDLGKYTIRAIAAKAGYASSEESQVEVSVRDKMQELNLSADSYDLYTNVEGKPAAVQVTYSYAPNTADIDAITWKSSNTSVATVDENGYITAVKSGVATITASADGVSDSCTVNVHTLATDFNATNALKINKDLGTVQMKFVTEPAWATNTQYSYQIEPSDREGDEKGLAFITKNGLVLAAKNGVVKVTVTNNTLPGMNTGSITKSFYIELTNQNSFDKAYCPVFTQTTFDINTHETVGKVFSIIPLYEYEISDARIDSNYEYADCFALEKGTGEYQWVIALTEAGKETLGNKSYKVPIVVESNDTFTQTVTVKISNKEPAVTLNKITVNPFYPNGEYEITAKSKVGNVTVLGIEDSAKAAGFTQNFMFDADKETISMAESYDNFVVDGKNKPVLEGTVILQVDGYEPQKATIKVTVKSKEPKLETAVKSYNMNYIKLNDDKTMVVGIKNVISSKEKKDLTTISSVSLNPNGGKNYEKVKDWVEVDVDEDGVSIAFTSDSVAAGTYTIPLLISSQDDENPQNDFYDAKCNVKVVVKKENQLPKLTLKTKSLKLNKRLVGEVGVIDMKSIDQTNAKLVDFVIEPAAAKGSSNVDEAVEMRYNPVTNQLEAELTDSLPGCNKYVFNCTPVFEGINEGDATLVKPIAVTVSLIDKEQAVSVSAKGSIDPINREGSEIRYTIKKTNFTDKVDSVEMIEAQKLTDTILDGREYFEEPVLNDDGTISLKAKSDVTFTKKCKYAFRFKLTMENCGETVVSKDITVTPKQSSVKLTASRTPLFYNKVNATRNVVPVTLSASKGSIARVEYDASANKKVPDAFDVEIDSNGQLEAIVFDGTQNVKKGTYTLTLNVYYEGQIWEAATAKAVSYEKPVAYKLKVTVK